MRVCGELPSTLLLLGRRSVHEIPQRSANPCVFDVAKAPLILTVLPSGETLSPSSRAGRPSTSSLQRFRSSMRKRNLHHHCTGVLPIKGVFARNPWRQHEIHPGIIHCSWHLVSLQSFLEDAQLMAGSPMMPAFSRYAMMWMSAMPTAPLATNSGVCMPAGWCS